LEVGDVILFFGCRSKSEDFIYEKELAQYAANKTLTALHVACSRDQGEKIYVHHLMYKQKVPYNYEALFQLLNSCVVIIFISRIC